MTNYSYLFTPRAVPYSYQTVPEALEFQAGKFPNHEILVFRKIDGWRETLTYKELYTQAVKMAKSLVEKGIKKGDKVALYGANTLQWVVGEIAIIMAGGVVVHVTSSVKDASDLQEILAVAECRGILIDPGANGMHRDFISHFLQSPSPLIFVFLRIAADFSDCDNLPSIVEKEETDTELPKLSPEDEILFFTTSGSTGKPKMICHSHFGVLNNAYFQRPDRPSTLYNDRPFGWISGSPLVNIAYGTTRVFADSSVGVKGGDPMKIWNLIREENCSHALLMPYYLADLIGCKDDYKDVYLLHAILLGGQVIDQSYSQVIGIYSETLCIGYGLTENGGVTTLWPDIRREDNINMGDVGVPCEGVEMKIIDETGSTLPRDQPGELCMRSRVAFHEYYKNPEATRATFIAGGWFRSGDIAVITKNGRIVIKGRIKNVISRRTRKIFPDAIEKVVNKMDGLSHVVVVAVQDKRLYEEICVCFVAKPQIDVTEDDVKDFCAQHFDVKNAADGYGEMPTYFLKFGKFPMLDSGKPDKKEMQTEALRRLGIQIG
uniref:Acyl-CoA synthetase family member 2, mitochondrial n=1 Tax=Magallana gigas TaxID=29159 RepID=K1QIU0_MAGGI|eukprot:XP_011427423.1 PREDICTED: acyl-CoA synthetase family member 2, mitochondrial [Crassostrea gigas]